MVLGGAGCVTEVQGEAFDPVRECWGGTKTFDYSGGQGCDDGVTFGRDANGGIWKFRNGCIGDDLEPANDFNDGDYLDCPPSGVGFVDLEQREVNVEAMCLRPWESSLRRNRSDEPCTMQGPELKRFSTGRVILYSNHCQTSPTEPYSDYTADEVIMWPECSE
jgi:hypothetical protein